MQSASLAQLARQAVPVELHLMVPLAQLTALPVAHAPLPLHDAGATFAKVLPLPGVHTDGHAVPLPGYVHDAVLTPLHVPAHIASVALQAVRGATGAPVTAVHVPSEPVTLHASHWPVHAELQQ